ncbi:MAG: hypothetical protein ASARMPRED_000285 [Alectoria sarmentosa]|nr:MAG: hypothetical protein ASARMPRED_000285 [Alectoria sarmentosa]
MTKRKFMQDDDENAQDPDYRDYQFSDDDEDVQEPDNRDSQDPDYRDYQFSDDEYEPSLVDEDNEHLSIPSRRVVRSGSTLTASGPQDLDDEEAQGETSDSEGDASYEDNTSEAPRQKTADDPQVQNGNLDGSDEVRGGRVRIVGKTKYCGVITARVKEPQKAKRTQGDFFCPICDSSFTRAEGVNYHFSACAKKHGNPQGHSWNSHPSCANRNSRKNGLATASDPHVQPSTSKKINMENNSSESSSASSSDSDEVVQAQPVPQPATLPGGYRPLPTGPRAAQSSTHIDEIVQTQPASQSGSLATGPSTTRSKPTQRRSQTQPDSGISSIQTSSTSTQRRPKPSTTRPKPSTARPKPPQTRPVKKQRTSNPKKTQKRKPKSKKASGVGEQVHNHRLHIDGSLPPISDLGAMFHDMLSNASEKTPWLEALEILSGKQIRIATMCSGTESPLLALEKIQNDLRLSGKPPLDIKHLFSAEIVPYKQAYIERNFGPDYLFRDMRELAEGGQATTAYGALVDVPSGVNLLVAGFSCVDFSKLNKNSKKLTDNGESGDTFRAIARYARNCRPAVIILENVDGAPWELIRAIWENDHEPIEGHFEKLNGPDADAAERERNAFWSNFWTTFWADGDPAYAAFYQRVDTKNYYIPQTRTRRYMICLDRCQFPSPQLADKAAQSWQCCMVALERKASVSVEAFLLPVDDRRLQCAKDEMSKYEKPKFERDWEVCNGRYEGYRADEKLGILRPILNWTNDGSVKASSYLWTDWTFMQVERIWDTIEISYLRNAARGYDAFFKTRFWELSQNIDRFTDETPAGVIGCLTPSGQPFSTTRGGPVTGREAIALQGLPVDELLLTRESQRELFDLAGNAMTSTVIGAALLSALTVSCEVLTNNKQSTSQPVHDPSSDVVRMRFSELRPKEVLKFDGSDETSFEELCWMAKTSVCLCHCEGQNVAAPALIRECKHCHHYCCKKCGNTPKHDYELFGGTGVPLRTEPQEFRKRVRYAIPTRLEIDGLSSERLEDLAQRLPGRPQEDWVLFSEAILLASKQEYRYEFTKRSYRWTVSYSAAHARLELIFDQDEVYWLLYGEPAQSATGDSRVRKLLETPLARLTVRGTSMRGDHISAENMLGGSWEIRCPIEQKFQITFTPQGKLTDSWEKKLGLQGERFIDKQVYTSLHVARTSEPGLILDHEIDGDYDLLENCGTACSSLHKKRPTTDARDAPSLFLFLDADRIGPPEHDCYVFSNDIHRLEYGENRYIAAKVDSEWRPPCEGSHPRADRTVSSQAACHVISRWEPCPIVLRPHEGLEEAFSRVPKSEISMPVFGTDRKLLHSSRDDMYGCLHETATTALLSCEIPSQLADSAGWQVGRWTIIDQKSERQIAAAFAWLFARVKDLGDFEGGWRSLGPRPSGYQKCLSCAPDPPKIMWTCSRNDKGNDKGKIIPYEDGREAGDFERKIKARPAPFLVQAYIDSDGQRTGRLLVGLNLPTLIHRALARLGNIADSDEIDLKWRLDTRFEVPTRYKLRELTLRSNELILEAEYAFPTGLELRPEQKRSLQWMIGQEADDMAFYEEEIEEATLSQLGWRAEARVRRTRIVRGGVLADEVGYGKTATTLALIDAQKKSAEEYPGQKRLGCISVKATLILVPPHLVHQWKQQADKFLGENWGKILVIEDVTQLAKISVQRITRAAIIIASWKVLSSPSYMDRMSYFAALPPGPSSGERETDAWLSRACGNIEKHMGELVSDYKSPKRFAAALKRRLEAAHSDKDILRNIPTQRLKGAKYTTWNPAECVTPTAPGPKKEDIEKSLKHLRDCKDLDSMTGILLHMFDFHRLVVDEYTYVDGKQKVEKLSSFINTIHARSRWVLSGTPNIQDFGDVRHLAKFLAYNLGVVDDAAGVIKSAAIRHIREDRTAAEQFRAFGYSHTAAWHISRQAHAQRFLDKYASKNVADIGVIESMLHLRPNFLSASETILNAELQQQLQSTDMKIVLYGKSKKDNDRIRRYRDLLKDCKTASECLLKSCLFFALEDSHSAENEASGNAMDVDEDDDSQDHVDSDPATAIFEACKALIIIRENQKRALIIELEEILLHAAWLEQQCARSRNPEHRGSHYHQWKSEVERVGLRDPTATSELRDYLRAALVKVDTDTEEIFYRDPPTAEELRKEKKALEKRNKRDKAKRTANRKAKNVCEGTKTRRSSRKTKATVHLDEDCEEMVVADNESSHRDDDDPPDPRSYKIQKDDSEMYASVLRSLTGLLRSLATELTSRTRSLRFSRGAQDLQQWHSGLGKPPTCRSCGKVVPDHDSISINIRCGHLTCQECIQKTNLVECTVVGCGEGSDPHNMRKAEDLVGDGKAWRYGSKLGHIIELIDSLPDDEQILLFVQFDDMMVNIASALEAAGISNYALSKTAGSQIVDMMIDFQDNNGDTKKRVLLLNPSSETAAGINLTNANHIIFASPLLTDTQQEYNASSTQCIGRAKRYGQQKTVHVYRILALRTIDVDILQEREQKTLAKKKDLEGAEAAEVHGLGGGDSYEEWVLVEENAIGDTLEAGWGSGYNFKSNPTEEEY